MLKAQAEQNSKDPEFAKAQADAAVGNAAALKKLREKQKEDSAKIFAAAGAFNFYSNQVLTSVVLVKSGHDV